MYSTCTHNHVLTTIHTNELTSPTNMVRWCSNTQAPLTKIHLVPVVVPDGKDKGFVFALCQFDAAELLPHNRVCSDRTMHLWRACTQYSICYIHVHSPPTKAHDLVLTWIIERGKEISIRIHAAVNNNKMVQFSNWTAQNIHITYSVLYHSCFVYLRVSRSVFSMCESVHRFRCTCTM